MFHSNSKRCIIQVKKDDPMAMMEPSDASVSVADWWEYHHGGNGNFHLWLTGSNGPDVWRSLHIYKHIFAGQVVLNIGVGLGNCTRSLVKQGCCVDVLDISRSALDKVRNVVHACWLPETFNQVWESVYDLAISNLVTQHMCDEDLMLQISAVVKRLKPDGIFAMQFAFAWDNELNDNATPDDTLLKGGGVCRTLGRMVQLVQSAGGAVVWANRIGMFPNYRSGWYALHIVRPDFPHINSMSDQSNYLNRLSTFFKRFLP